MSLSKRSMKVSLSNAPYGILKNMLYTCQHFKGPFFLTCQHLIKSFCFYILQNKDIIVFVMLTINIKEQTTISAKLLGLTMVCFYLKTEVSVLFPFVKYFFFFFMNKFWKFVEMNIIQLKIDQPTSNAKIEQFVWLNSTYIFFFK